MSQTVLVIDSNSAVQAITALALNQTDCTVETLADGAQAYQKIQSLKPCVVLCAREIAGVDPFELCRRVKAEQKRTAFVLLAPADGMKNTSEKAKESDFDEVIFKPFKSNRLREVVTELMSRGDSPSAAPRAVLISCDDSLRERSLELLLKKNGVPVLAAPPDAGAAGCVGIIELSSAPNFSAVDCEKLYVLAPEASASEARKRYPSAEHISLPLNGPALLTALAELLPEQPALEIPTPAAAPNAGCSSGNGASGSSHPAIEGRAELAAALSARIFKRLLSEPATSTGAHEELARIVRDEVLAHGREADSSGPSHLAPRPPRSR